MCDARLELWNTADEALGASSIERFTSGDVKGMPEASAK
jgi:hypothetical protein